MLLDAMGLSPSQKKWVADALMHGALSGHPGQGQGFDKLPRMWQRIQAKTIDLHARVETRAQGSTWALWEAHNGLGIQVAAQAMEAAVEQAKEQGMGAVFVRGSTHLSSAGFHALLAAEKGLLGLCMTNAGPEMAPWGGTTPILGTNPWGMAVPTTGPFPLLLDIALTQSGKGMVRWHQEQGLPIPTHWAFAPDGSTTDDPTQALAGTLVPIGEYKGVGLSFMTDVLCGVLTGAAFGQDCYADPKRHNVGHVLMAIAPERFMARELFYQRLEEFCRQYKSSETMQGVSEVYLPGELEYLRKRERLRQGIPVSSSALEALNQLAQELDVSCQLVMTGTKGQDEGAMRMGSGHTS